MPIRSIPPFHPNPPKRGSSRSSWGSSKAIGGTIRIGQVELDLDQLSDISGLNELQARLAQTQGEPKGREAKLQTGGKVSVSQEGSERANRGYPGRERKRKPYY